MSYTEMYTVTLDGDVTLCAEFKNSWRGAMLVWNQMSWGVPGMSGFPFDKADRQKVWDLHKDPRVNLSHRIVMAATFDKVMVKRENLSRLVEAIVEYSSVFDPGNLSEQMVTLNALAQDEDCLAVCWNQTSVNSGIWESASPAHDEYGEPIYRPYNIFLDSEHWFLFEADAFSQSIAERGER